MNSHPEQETSFFNKENGRRTLTVMVFVIFIFLWEFLVRVFDVPVFVLPSPSKILHSLIVNTRSKVLLEHAWITFSEGIIGFIIGCVAGVVLGLLMTRSKFMESILFPYVIGSQIIPKTVLAPLFVVWFGFGIRNKIVITAMMVFFPLLINVLLGLRSIDRNKHLLMRSLGASSWQVFRYLEVPFTMPYIFAGLKVSINLALVGAIVGEFVDPQAGLGYLVLVANGVLDVAMAFAAMIYLFVLGLGLYGIVVWAERHFLSWHVSTAIETGMA